MTLPLVTKQIISFFLNKYMAILIFYSYNLNLIPRERVNRRPNNSQSLIPTFNNIVWLHPVIPSRLTLYYIYHCMLLTFISHAPYIFTVPTSLYISILQKLSSLVIETIFWRFVFPSTYVRKTSRLILAITLINSNKVLLPGNIIWLIFQFLSKTLKKQIIEPLTWHEENIKNLSPIAAPFYPLTSFSPWVAPFYPKTSLSPLVPPIYPKTKLSPLAAPFQPSLSSFVLPYTSSQLPSLSSFVLYTSYWRILSY
uniref:Uncharacterized protein n=1 Tax=Cacopsylla melanoneura TaxID=428564 RepID=A0A8D8SR18_9HEMI